VRTQKNCSDFEIKGSRSQRDHLWSNKHLGCIFHLSTEQGTCFNDTHHSYTLCQVHVTPVTFSRSWGQRSRSGSIAYGIFWTWWLMNHWRNFNQNLHKYFQCSCHEPKFFNIMWSKVKIIERRPYKITNIVNTLAPKPLKEFDALELRWYKPPTPHLPPKVSNRPKHAD